MYLPHFMQTHTNHIQMYTTMYSITFIISYSFYIRHIFGYPGGAILPIFDGIHGCPDFEFILPRHEQGAGHMAEGYG